MKSINFIQDRYATGRVLPTLDSQQDYNLISGIQKDGITNLTFSRKFITNDEKDLPLEVSCTFVPEYCFSLHSYFMYNYFGFITIFQ